MKPLSSYAPAMVAEDARLKKIEFNLKSVQILGVVHLGYLGRPMTDFPRTGEYLQALPIPSDSVPSAHWSRTSGEDIHDAIDEVRS